MIFGTPVWNDDILWCFFIFSKFWFFELLVGQKGIKWPKMTKNYLSFSISQELYIMWSSFIVHMCKMIFLGIFFIFQNCQKKAKKNCLLQSIFQELYIIWLSFMVQMCKMIIPLGFFFFSFFQNLNFPGHHEGKRGTNGPKWQKKIVSQSLYLRNHASYDLHYGTHL